MLNKTTTPKHKKLSKGQRKHVRRLKQEARKASIPDSTIRKVAPVAAKPAE